MSFISLFAVALALSMDAFAASVCKGLSVSKVKFAHALTAGAYFGFFQALMLVLGYVFAGIFARSIESAGHMIAFSLLCAIGIGLMREGEGEEEAEKDAFSARAMISMAFATSIDAMAVGASFLITDGADIYLSAAVVGSVACLCSFFGVFAGNLFGAKGRKRARISGGMILILIGVKILFGN